MNCPKCGAEYVCPCGSCAEGHSKGKLAWIEYEDNIESCPKCGIRLSIQELDRLEQEQYEQELKNSGLKEKT